MSISTELQRIIDAKADIKTAINDKGGTLTTETIDAYAAAIDNISGGGPSETFKVIFLDYDGTVLKEENVSPGANATPPTPPTHANLTFQEWNNNTTNIQTDILIGATYAVNDSRYHFFIELNEATGY
jgi:hypothetical protein